MANKIFCYLQKQKAMLVYECTNLWLWIIWTVMYSIITTWVRKLWYKFLTGERTSQTYYYQPYYNNGFEDASDENRMKQHFDFNVDFNLGLCLVMSICSTAKVSFSCL